MNLTGEGLIPAQCGKGALVSGPAVSEAGARHSNSCAAAGCMEWLAGRPSVLSRTTRGLSGQALLSTRARCAQSLRQQRWCLRRSSPSGRMSHTTNLTVKLCKATHPCKILQGAHSLAVMLHLQRDPALQLHAEGSVCKGADVIMRRTTAGPACSEAATAGPGQARDSMPHDKPKQHEHNPVHEICWTAWVGHLGCPLLIVNSTLCCCLQVCGIAHATPMT